MLLEDLGALLEEASVGTVGSDLFYYSAPDEAKQYTLLMYGGDGIPINWDLPRYYKVRFQAIIRAANYTDGFAIAESVMNTLTFYESETTQYYVKQCLPKEEPRPYRRGDAGILEFSLNFDIVFIKKDANFGEPVVVPEEPEVLYGFDFSQDHNGIYENLL